MILCTLKYSTRYPKKKRQKYKMLHFCRDRTKKCSHVLVHKKNETFKAFWSNLRWHTFKRILTKQVRTEIKVFQISLPTELKICTERPRNGFYLHFIIQSKWFIGNRLNMSLLTYACLFTLALHITGSCFLCFAVPNASKSRSFHPLRHVDRNAIK